MAALISEIKLKSHFPREGEVCITPGVGAYHKIDSGMYSCLVHGFFQDQNEDGSSAVAVVELQHRFKNAKGERIPVDTNNETCGKVLDLMVTYVKLNFM